MEVARRAGHGTKLGLAARETSRSRVGEYNNGGKASIAEWNLDLINLTMNMASPARFTKVSRKPSLNC